MASPCREEPGLAGPEFDPDEPPAPVVSATTTGTATIAEPMPNATASAPTRPTNLAAPPTAGSLRCPARDESVPAAAPERCDNSSPEGRSGTATPLPVHLADPQQTLVRHRIRPHNIHVRYNFYSCFASTDAEPSPNPGGSRRKRVARNLAHCVARPGIEGNATLKPVPGWTPSYSDP